MTNRSTLRSATAVVAAAVTLSACSGDETPADPTSGDQTSTSSSADGSETAGGQDRSDEVIKAYTEPTVLGSISGKAKTPLGTQVLTIDVTGLRTGPTGTVLSYAISTKTSSLPGIGRAEWALQPRLTVKASDAYWNPSTVTAPRKDGTEAELCVCSGTLGAGPVSTPQYAYYPALPDGVDSVAVSLPGLKPVTVPVTR
ncbi:hypothetical protein [Janibacter sp. G1551]|uniref:hypothetical protein n=1 Tax=Janibacter sp. G1551 TaxID=3420440 RepID=UPI003D05B44B